MIEIVTQPDSTITCALVGDLDVVGSIRLRHVVAHLTRPGLTLVIDLGGVGHVGAIGISAVIGVTRLVHSRGGTVTVTNADSEVHWFLQRLVGDHCLAHPSGRPGGRAVTEMVDLTASLAREG